MKKEVLKELGGDSLQDLLKRANAKEIKKEQIVQIVEIKGELHMVYVD